MGVVAHAFGEASFLDRRTASGVQGGRMDRAIRVARGKQKRLWPGEPPISEQDGEQLRGKRRFAIFTTLAVAHVDDAARAVDIRDPQATRIRALEPGGVETTA